MKIKHLLGYSVFHFVVDLSCIYFMMSDVVRYAGSGERWLLLAVIYNFMAFALPALLGLISDMVQKNDLLAAIGCILIAIGYMLSVSLTVSVVLIGIGNGLFHIGGGRQILNESEQRYAPSGIFISTGAMGVWLGSLWGKTGYNLKTLFGGCMLLCAIVLLCMYYHWKDALKEKKSTVFEGVKPDFAAFAFALLIVVVIRSHYGAILNYSWKSPVWMGCIFTCMIVGGKFAGGLIADKIGIKKATMLSLGMAGALALFSFESSICGCLSIFFFNMTMPLTLSLMAELFPKNPGFAFGLLMFALFIGTLPTLVGDWNFLFSKQGLFGLCLISLVLMQWEIRMKGKS